VGARAPTSTIQLRKEFLVEKDVRRALAFISGLGQHELRLNGRKVGDNVLDPGWTNYRRTCPYVTHDVTAQHLWCPPWWSAWIGNSPHSTAARISPP
jgi:hypothetical protein